MEDQRRDPRNRLRSWRSNRRLRLASYPHDRPVHVQIGTQSKQPHFKDPFLAGVVLGLTAGHPLTLAACVMPDHLHWVLTSATELPSTVGAFKSKTTVLARRCGRNERIWQRSFFDHVVRASEDLRALVDYVLANPHRAGLIRPGETYPYSVLWKSRFPG